MQPAKPNTLLHRARATLHAFVQRYPVLCLITVAGLSNVLGTIFNIAYNLNFVVNRCSPQQQEVFYRLMMVYNPIAFPLGLGIVLAMAWPLRRHHTCLRLGGSPADADLKHCRRTLIRLPFYLMLVNCMCWLPGTFIFPAVICWLGGPENAGAIWRQFILSWGVGMLLTVVQTLFFVEEFLIGVLYPYYFRDSRPADVGGGLQSFFWRMILFWLAVAFMPMLAVGVLAWSIADLSDRVAFLVTVAGGSLSGLCISGLVGWSLWRWLQEHQRASASIARGEFTTRVAAKRPDEWGKLTDRFNDMASGLQQAEKERETFGQVLHPKIRDALMQRYPGLGGEVQTVTVMFVDIRGFTRRSAGEPPEKVVALLNRFMTLAISAIEDDGAGVVNKFLGDGLMALFGILQPGPDHADQALAAAEQLVYRLRALNADLTRHGEEPLRIGVGIHTGPALVGCVGATTTLPDGQQTMRREFTAIGETINLGQRMEQLTKSAGGPVLLSAQARQYLRQPARLKALGAHRIQGYELAVEVYGLEVSDATDEVPTPAVGTMPSPAGGDNHRSHHAELRQLGQEQ